jgi:quercetin dioxygenase-like cupin family protein
LCIRGQLEYEVGDQRYILEPGDSLLFASKIRHRWRNPGKNVTNAVFVLSGFEEDEHPSEHHLKSGQLAEEKSENEVKEDEE